jgi:DNA-binding transcriptional MocR family regulator
VAQIAEICATQDGSDAIWGKSPKALATNRDLSRNALRVHILLACGLFNGNTANIGSRLIAKQLGIGQRTVCRAIVELIEAGFISSEHKSRARGVYRFTSPAFAAKTGGSGATNSSGEPLVLCGSCRKPCKRLGKTGWCRSCVSSEVLAQKVAQARKELGADSSESEIAHHIHLRRITPRIAKLLRKMAAA